MAVRDLSGPGQTRAIRDLLQSLFVCEVINPSRPLWLFFAWVTDIYIVDNSARQFAALCPDWPASPIRLSDVLSAILNRGGAVNVIMRQDPHNDGFAARLEEMKAARENALLKYCVKPEFHEKGMLGDDYLLEGSMNLTHRGISVNDEHVLLRCDPASVAQRRIALHGKWATLLQ